MAISLGWLDSGESRLGCGRIVYLEGRLAKKSRMLWPCFKTSTSLLAGSVKGWIFL